MTQIFTTGSWGLFLEFPKLNKLRVYHNGSERACQARYVGPIPITRSTMFLFNIFSKMKGSIRLKVLNEEPGLYVAVIFPIAAAFLITFIGARIISHIYPDMYIPGFGIHVHHFAYGFFILAGAGYLALTFSSPRAKYLIALLHGLGLGLAFDEYGLWLHLTDDDPARWSYDGFLIIAGFIFIIISAKGGIKLVLNHWPFRRSKKLDF